VRERLWRSASSGYLRVLPKVLGVKDRGYSRGLQRAITDFGAERSFGQAVAALQEHYGVTVPVSAAMQITYKHAARVQEASCRRAPALRLPGIGVESLVAEADGSMVPIVQTSGRRADRRKNRQIDYREARLCACQASGKAQIHYEATFAEVDQVGQRWAQGAKAAGAGLQTKIHVVSDGAVWIHQQAQRWLQPHRHLLDFYHLCGYLAAAEATCAQNPRWFSTQKKRLQTNHHERVLKALEAHLEAPSLVDELAPVRCAHRYLSHRTAQVDYAGALAEKLPIGSGMIESGHKHVIQARLKIAGASWNINNAEALLQLRTTRANDQWKQLWNN